ncbi:FAD-dependent oxidoreductase [candidate division MSBL1 archaeon SCGC-AAA261F19]|uniref:FAD-dependent oxidoreductase n=1 Tax=candidate division MSBL1 archaeon SCGC-AAA261F19 TaxID=1698275 RepID=A0A133VAS2_9EURY|nr:FAD-dependent oxidoreductase [candidate division MSBL1 archaeon SCGC-AAA261F19]
MVDVLIIGGGPAGLFAAHELAENSNLSVEVIEKGKKIQERECPAVRTGECIGCEPCDVMCGLGGAGGMSDGTLNLRHDIGGDLTEFTTLSEANRLIEKVDSIFEEHGAPAEIYGERSKETEDLARKAAAAGIKFIPIRQRHIGSEYLPDIIESLQKKLEKGGVRFRLGVNVDEVKKDGIIVGNKKIKPRFILAAPGRSGATWLAEQARNLGIGLSHTAIDVGVRVEVPKVVVESVVKASRDPKFHIMTKTFDDFVRTFCTNHGGFVVEERYEDYTGVNGHSLRTKKSDNSNFAFLSRVKLTEPVTDTLAYGRSIGYLATTIGGGRPLVQRLGDLRHGRRSTKDRIERGHIEPTLRSVTPGDISMALPGRITTNIREGLDQLDDVIPGVASDSTLLYAPEVKLYATRISLNERMETSVDNLFLAGDGAGLSRDMVNAGATGILAARGIMKKAGLA